MRKMYWMHYNSIMNHLVVGHQIHWSLYGIQYTSTSAIDIRVGNFSRHHIFRSIGGSQHYRGHHPPPSTRGVSLLVVEHNGCNGPLWSSSSLGIQSDCIPGNGLHYHSLSRGNDHIQFLSRSLRSFNLVLRSCPL